MIKSKGRGEQPASLPCFQNILETSLRGKKNGRKTKRKNGRGVIKVMAYGDVVCRNCGKYIGNYATGDGNYYSLIKTKYCKACKPIMKNIQSKFSKSNNHKARKLLLNEYIDQVGLLKQENQALREMVKELKNQLRS